MPLRHQELASRPRATSPSHALFCCAIQIGAASRLSTCETSPKNEQCLHPPIGPFRRGSTRVPSSLGSPLFPCASVPDLARLGTSARNGSYPHRHRPVRRQVPVRQN